MESNGSYGSKIQTLVRHLLHIQLVEPGAKSIVFSAWADSLTSELVIPALPETLPLIMFPSHRACSSFKRQVEAMPAPMHWLKTLLGIPCIRLDQNQGRGRDGGAKRFRIDPHLQVLLLHGYVDHDFT